MTSIPPQDFAGRLRSLEKKMAQQERHRHPLNAFGMATPDTVSGVEDDTGQRVPITPGAASVPHPISVVGRDPWTPSDPIVAVVLGTITVTWDGRGAGDENLPGNFAWMEVHRSMEGPDFDTGPLTRVGHMRASGTLVFSDQAYDDVWYYRLVMVNNISQLSQPSVAVVGTLVRVANSDIITVSADKMITGTLQAGVKIYAGPPTGTHAELTFEGLRSYVDDPVDNVPNEVVRIGTNDNDVLAISDSTGQVKATIDENGYISGSGINSDTDPTFQGMPLVGLLGNTLPDIVDFQNDPVAYGRDYEVDPVGIIEQYAKGTVAWAQFSGTAFTNTIVSGEEMSLFELGFDCEPGRQYSFGNTPILFEVTGSGQVALLIRYTSDGSQPTLASPILAYDYQDATDGYQSLCVPMRPFNGGAIAQTQLRVMVSVRSGGPGLAVFDTQGIFPVISDTGPIKSPTGDVRNDFKTGITPPPVIAPTRITRALTWFASSSATYKGDGSRRFDTSNVVQGYYSFNGDGKGLWIFPSMTAALAGSTINKIEIYAYSNFWWYNSGGTALIKIHGYTSVPGSSPSMTAAVTSNGWHKPGGYWVTLPSWCYAGFLSGTYRGFGVGPAGGTNLLYYGRFNGGNGSARIRVTHTR